jgi:hypothetical protein
MKWIVVALCLLAGTAWAGGTHRWGDPVAKAAWVFSLHGADAAGGLPGSGCFRFHGPTAAALSTCPTADVGFGDEAALSAPPGTWKLVSLTCHNTQVGTWDVGDEWVILLRMVPTQDVASASTIYTLTIDDLEMDANQTVITRTPNVTATFTSHYLEFSVSSATDPGADALFIGGCTFVWR